MTGTILDYLIEYGDVSFAEMRFTEVDAAILCKLSYFHFDGIVPDLDSGMPSVSLSNIMLMEDHDSIFEKGAYEETARTMVKLMLGGKRFSGLRLALYSACFDRESQTQFAAITFLTGPRRMFVVFRGTDSSLIGLKEDFNLLYTDHAKCHEYAVDYLRRVSRAFSHKIYVGGHSKGGHLAVYACMNMPEEINKRIHRIYSLDGLGLRPTMMKDGKFGAIENRLYKLIPQSSLIGMMLEDDGHYEVVRSTGLALVQHNIYTWVVDGRRFVREKKLKNNAVFVEHTFNGWVESQDDENRKRFIDGIYSVIDACEAERLKDLLSDGGKRFGKILEGIKELDDDSRQQIKEVFKAFVVVARFYLKTDVGGNIKNSAEKETRMLIDTGKKAIDRSKKVIKKSKKVINKSKSVIKQSKKVIKQSKKVLVRNADVIKRAMDN